MGRIRKSILIRAGPEDVFAYMDDVRQMGHHMMGMGRDFRPEILSKNATGVGAVYRFSGTMYGVKFGWTEVVTRWAKNKEKFHHSEEGGGWIKRLDMGWTLAPAHGGTGLTLTMDYDLGYSLLGKLLDRLWLERYCSEGLDMDFQHMKEALENHEEMAGEGGQVTAKVTT